MFFVLNLKFESNAAEANYYNIVVNGIQRVGKYWKIRTMYNTASSSLYHHTIHKDYFLVDTFRYNLNNLSFWPLLPPPSLWIIWNHPKCVWWNLIRDLCFLLLNGSQNNLEVLPQSLVLWPQLSSPKNNHILIQSIHFCQNSMVLSLYIAHSLAGVNPISSIKTKWLTQSSRCWFHCIKSKGG